MGMTAIEMRDKIEKLYEDKTFISMFREAKTPEQYSEIMKKEGFDISVDEIKHALEEDFASEIDIDELEMVSGGGKLKYISPGYWFGRLLYWATFGRGGC